MEKNSCRFGRRSYGILFCYVVNKSYTDCRFFFSFHSSLLKEKKYICRRGLRTTVANLKKLGSDLFCSDWFCKPIFCFVFHFKVRRRSKGALIYPKVLIMGKIAVHLETLKLVLHIETMALSHAKHCGRKEGMQM